MKKTLLLILLILPLSLSLFPQDTITANYLRKKDFAEKYSELKTLYGQEKSFPSDIELECLVALSHFPELSDTDIEFVYKKFRFTATMKTKPKNNFVFRRKNTRKYVIHINNNQGKKQGVNISNLSFNALVGLIAHELSHIVDYSDRSMFSILYVGIRYITFKKYVKRTERQTDITAIEHGLGYSLYEFKDHLMNSPETSEKYKNKQAKYYLSPDEVLEYIQKTSESSSIKIQ